MNTTLYRVKRFCRFTVGIVFFISGVLKLVDPVGAGFVVDEYYKFFNVGFLAFSSRAVAVFLALVETFTGAALITGLWRKIVATITLSLTGFFTILTLILVIFNPTMDCGCFGEAVHLTHLQTFIKNIILVLLSLAAFVPYHYLGRPKKKKYVSFALVAAAVAAFTLYSLLYIPLVDFTDYKPGVRLAAAGEDFSEDAVSSAYDAVFIYAKDGKTEEFTLDNLPDSTWTFVETRTVETGTVGKSAGKDTGLSVSIIDRNAENRDGEIAQGKVMAIAVSLPEKMTERKWNELAAYMDNSEKNGFAPVLLVAAVPDSFEKMIPESLDGTLKSSLISKAYYSDYKTLATMVRSNGGAVYFNDGYLIRKWAFRNLPDDEALSELAGTDSTETYLSYGTRGNLTFQAFLLYAFAVMLLL